MPAGGVIITRASSQPRPSRCGRLAGARRRVQEQPAISHFKRLYRQMAVVLTMPDPSKDLASMLDQMSGALTVSELVPILGDGRSPLYEMAAGGGIPHYRIGSSIRFDPHKLHGGCEPGRSRLHRSRAGETRPSPFDGIDLVPHLGPSGRTQIAHCGRHILMSGEALNGAQIDATAKHGG
jgi:hypothetical protein